MGRLLGQRGSVRVDWVFRDFGDFYSTRTDLSTGQVTNAQGTFDVNLIENSNDLSRRYQGGTFQANYRFGSNVDIGGNYTLSRTWGNFDGENPASGPLTAQLFSYPEYREARWNAPEGNLGTDQRHRARIYGIYRVPMASSAGSLDVGLVLGMASGTPYTFGGANSTSPGTGVGRINSSPYVVNPGYAQPVTSVEYYFFERDAYRTEAQYRTDLSVNYQYRRGWRSGCVLPRRGVEHLRSVPAVWLWRHGVQQRRRQRHPDDQHGRVDGVELWNAAALQPVHANASARRQLEPEPDVRHGREPLCLHEPTDVPVQLWGEVLDQSSVLGPLVLGRTHDRGLWTVD